MCPALAFGQAQLSTGIAMRTAEGGTTTELVAIRLTPFDIRGLHREMVFGSMPLDERKRMVPSVMQQHAEETQRGLLESARAVGLHIRPVRTSWLLNLVVAELSMADVARLAALPGVVRISLDAEDFIRPIEPPREENGAATRSVGGHEPGHDAIGAPALWAMGYTGRNRLAFLVDTGVWPDEPALNGKFLGETRPLSQSWFPYDSNVPLDKSNSHGTHCIGTVMGLDPTTNDTIGVAFNGHFIATDPVVQNLADVKPLSEFVYAFEWALNPDGDLSTTSDIPDVITNSWGHGTLFGGDTCAGPFMDILEAVHAAGIASVHSAGNDGPAAMTIGVPSTMNFDLVNIFSVGSIQAEAQGYPISSFSSRGPTICGGSGSLAIKPEVVAPGQNVRSCIHGGYDQYSGTSMAAPHVSGMVLLLKEAFPEVAGEEILFALYSTATDLGDVGEDNTFGNGLINGPAAFAYLSQFHTSTAPITNDLNLFVEGMSLENGLYHCGSTDAITAQLRNTGTTVINGFSYRYSITGQTEVTGDHAGDLQPGQMVNIDLGSLTFPADGDVEVHFAAEPNNSGVEFDDYDNSAIRRYNVRPLVDVPFFEYFESNLPTGSLWALQNPENDKTWDTLRCTGLPWTQLSTYVNHRQYSPRDNQFDGLVSPAISIPMADSAALRFSYGYAFRHQSFADTLLVHVSSDCGLTWGTALFRKGGQELSVFDTSGYFIPDSPSDWREVWLDMSAYMGSTVLIRFGTVNRNGNTLVLDDINVYTGQHPAAIASNQDTNASVYPNPGTDAVRIVGLGTDGPAAIELLDLSGRSLVQMGASISNGILSAQLPSDLQSGSYIIRIRGPHGVAVLPWTRM